ncbi:AcrR family transcriptional regulator [Conyzicola nivalis]|uniref:AcrR family transcriptional regulator n=2 Tax=Conyzicola nivalis TaxID=1477021 RepID=A0ABV2QPL6_9MICO
MLRDGYDAVSVEMIATTAGIGRTTVFRYFGSKPGVIWAAFDANIADLSGSISRSRAEDDPLDVIRVAILASTESATHDSAVWLERFELIDSVEALRPGAYQHWERWKSVLAGYVAERTGVSEDSVGPMAIAGAYQGIFVGTLRAIAKRAGDAGELLTLLDADLHRAAFPLRSLLSPTGRD